MCERLQDALERMPADEFLRLASVFSLLHESTTDAGWEASAEVLEELGRLVGLTVRRWERQDLAEDNEAFRRIVEGFDEGQQ